MHLKKFASLSFGTDLNITYTIVPTILDIKRRKRDTMIINEIGSFKNDHLLYKRNVFNDYPNFMYDDVVDDYKLTKLAPKKSAKKRSLDGQPLSLYVETLVVADKSVYSDHERYSGYADQDIVFLHMKIYLMHVFFRVS